MNFSGRDVVFAISVIGNVLVFDANITSGPATASNSAYTFSLIPLFLEQLLLSFLHPLLLPSNLQLELFLKKFHQPPLLIFFFRN